MRKTIEFGKLSVDLLNQWSQFFSKYNWIAFDVVKVYFERFDKMGTAEVEIAILGLGIRLYWVYNKEVYEESIRELCEKDFGLLSSVKKKPKSSKKKTAVKIGKSK